jgi:hypothetical protein
MAMNAYDQGYSWGVDHCQYEKGTREYNDWMRGHADGFDDSHGAADEDDGGHWGTDNEEDDGAGW